MKVLETENLQEIYILKFNDNVSYGKIFNITSTLEDAYDLAQNFLNDTFNYTKEEVIEYFNTSKSDYIDLYNKEKINYNEIYLKSHKDLDKFKYYFTIVKSYVEKIKK